ncbi:MAG: hypothetical protein H7X86_14010 [Gorillibacterium sp.]|nr:hypothetical protein [Gorillibacterium sp.]
MRHIVRYKLLYTTLVAIGVMVSSLWWTEVPTKGYLNTGDAKVPFQFVYIPNQSTGHLANWAKDNQNISFISGSAGLFSEKEDMLFSGVYPVYDHSMTLEQFEARFPNLPDSGIPEFGSSLYAIDYGQARFLFLDAKRLVDPASADKQLSWLKQSLKSGNYAYSIVYMSHDPLSEHVWQQLSELKISMVSAGNTVFALKNTIVNKPALMETASGQWLAWEPALTPNSILSAQGDMSELSITHEDADAGDLDHLTIKSIKREEALAIPMKELIGISSSWRYHPGDDSIVSTIPEGMDITGEIPEPGVVTAEEDWRHPDYEDSAWSMGRGPFGHTNRQQLSSFLSTKLQIQSSTPTYYFRKSFEVNGGDGAIGTLVLRVAYEDGFAAYLNGVEIARDGMPNGLITHRSLAAPGEEILYHEIRIQNGSDKLKRGVNIITVEVHRSHPGSPNLLFDLSLGYETKQGEL